MGIDDHRSPQQDPQCPLLKLGTLLHDKLETGTWRILLLFARGHLPAAYYVGMYLMPTSCRAAELTSAVLDDLPNYRLCLENLDLLFHLPHLELV